METKFKVGDIIREFDSNFDYYYAQYYTVIEIIEDKKMFTKKWGYGASYNICSLMLEKCYLLLLRETGFYYRLDFSKEKRFIIFKPSNKENILICPQCNGELKDHYSDWAGKEIKKCKACGWC